jgi:UDP-3-O-[3-hydroxymyristoyl] glucosamine N-acyltransferase
MNDIDPVHRFSVSDVLAVLGTEARVLGESKGRSFTKVLPVLEADEDSLVFISEDRKDKATLLAETRARIIICDPTVPRPASTESKCLIVVERPKVALARIATALFVSDQPRGIHPAAVVHPEAVIGDNSYIGPFTYVGKCRIGSDTIIHGHCHLYDGINVGSRVLIHAGTVIGADGFGYLRDESGDWTNFPHLGGVLIEDDVHVGACTCIDRGALGNTVIRSGAKIDNLVHIAHNVTIGRRAVVIAHAMIGGSTIVEESAWVSPCAAVRDTVTIGKGALVGLGAVVTKNVPDGETWLGSPARPIKEFLQLQQKIRADAS